MAACATNQSLLSIVRAKHRMLVCAIVVGVALHTGSKSFADADFAAGLEFFEKNVRPILVEHCYECHSGEERNGGLLVDSRDALLGGGDSGAAVVPGNAEKSRMIEAVRYSNRELQMPPDNRLSDEQIQILEEWVRMGLPDPRSSAAPAVHPTGMSIEEGREFWSFQPVADPAVPSLANLNWVKTPIDSFVLAALEENKLQPAPQADKRSLIRRVTLNLTGLPPTVEETNAFLADESDDAWSKLIDRLLESPQYGVRWGRHWLDVARYADSNGLDENLAYGHAWRYRDYVIDAFNNNKPFDRFLMEQLAGDLLPEASQETRTATAFLQLGAKVLAEPDMEKLVMDTIDEQLDATGKAFLGMTIGCARCHDHKFDPIKQRDYYALAAIFKSTRTFAETRTGVIKHWYEHSFATDADREKLKPIDAEIAKANSAAAAFKSAEITKIRTDARAKAVDYLVVSASIEPDATLQEFNAAATERELHPRILHHCRTHLEFHRYDPVFEAWHQLRHSGQSAIESHYEQLFSEVESAWTKQKAEDSKATALSDPQLEAVRLALNDASGFLAVPPKVEYAFSPEVLNEYNRLMEEARILESNAPDEPASMGVSEQETLASVPILIRGSHLNPGDEVPREFPEVMRVSNVRPVLPAAQSGRLELARWMAGTQHPLTARVFVNRVWTWHFGQGLVASTENFGRLGSPPTHPELLDWLARRFMSSGWNIKDLHRLILTSSVWQMATTTPHETAGQTTDPENKLLWKFRLRRLDAEQIRDSVLAVSGRLDRTIGGKTVPLRNRQFVFNHTSRDHTKYDSLRRSVYLPVIRNNLYPLFQQFDFPDPTMPTGRRSETVIAPQALLMMNSDLVIDSARQLAVTLLSESMSDEERISCAWQRITGRPSTPDENQRILSFINDITLAGVSATGVDDGERLRAWTMFCQSLFAGNEFMYVR